ncbi:hypothetical protein AB8965_07645 [Yersinia enterocolitica]|uniref:hypothetical protein n=1 Tax=Yersinia enterocolitica TaxID=630 RepID=UPI003D01AC00
MTIKYNLAQGSVDKVLRAMLVSELMRELLYSKNETPQPHVNSVNIAAVFDCIYEDLDSVLDNEFDRGKNERR